MLKGFIFNHNKCVNCGACNAACIIENGWKIHPRRIFTYNSEAFSDLPVVNLSLACNHCEVPVCLEGCPTASYSREPDSGAIVLDQKKCIGCKYCQWNCPYDAPQFDAEERVIGKCHLCYSRLNDGYIPACATACPTGALGFGELPDAIQENSFSWFPDKSLNPAIRFTGKHLNIPLRIVPENLFEQKIPVPDKKGREITGDWSLILFSLLTTLSVATIISSLIDGIFPDKILFESILMLAGLIALFHLGRWRGVWRVMANIKSSALSREIAMFILYSAVSSAAVIFRLPGLLIFASVIGLILLVVIDSVYVFADKRKSVIMHSGQTFLSALLIVSFFTGFIFPFIFIALIKLAASVYNLSYIKILSFNKNMDINSGIRFLRIALLIIAGTSLVSGISYHDPVIISLFLTGELFDRILFYIDFDPVNISTQLNSSSYETKSD